VAIAAPTPYVTPDVLMSQPTGISWGTFPQRESTDAEREAVLYNLCVQASAEIDEYINLTLRATVNQESLWGPGEFRCQMRPDGTTRLLLSSGPVIAVLGGQYSPSTAFPRTWVDLAAEDFAIEHPPLGRGSASASGSGEGGLSVLLRPGIVSWLTGRGSVALQVHYVSGWPHCGLDADAAAGDTTIAVDEVAGWMSGDVGGTGVIYSSTGQEVVTVVAASTDQGPGTLTLAAPLKDAHPEDTLLTTLPGSIIWAATLYAAAEALTRGATATTVQQAPGVGITASAGHDALVEHAQGLISAYRRVV
jgi:hypothetical protein